MTVFQARIFVYITQVFILTVGIIGFWKWRQLTRPLRLLNVFILISFVILIAELVMGFYSIRNLWVIHLHRVVELFFYSYIYYLWRPSKQFGYLLWSAYSAYLIIWMIGKFTFEPFYYMDVYSGAVSQIIQMGFGGWLIYEISKESDFKWNKDYRFLIISGVAIYAAAAFFLFTSFNFMLTLPRPLMRMIWSSNLIFLIMQYSFFLRGFLCKTAIPTMVISETTQRVK
jgi:hypothetical protein